MGSSGSDRGLDMSDLVVVKKSSGRTMLQNVYVANIVIQGVSGITYRVAAGGLISVKNEDVEGLLNFKSPGGCVGCGGNAASSPRFIKVEG